MTKDGVTLSEVVIMGNDSRRDTQMRSSQSLVRIGKSYLEMNLSGSLPQTLAGIPGVKAMNIGSGQSKPVIRGLGFNRMVVTENGICSAAFCESAALWRGYLFAFSMLNPLRLTFVRQLPRRGSFLQ